LVVGCGTNNTLLLKTSSVFQNTTKGLELGFLSMSKQWHFVDLDVDERIILKC